MRVYLAGKISKGDWRSEVFGHRPMSVDSSEAMQPWAEVEIPGTNHIAVGPWFVSCDHGCAHGANRHGQGIVAPCIQPSLTQDEVVERCFDAISRCDLLFAWVEPTAFGTITEMGYAKALGKYVAAAIATPYDTKLNDLWFPLVMADRVIQGHDAPTALMVALSETPVLRHQLCESPLEVRMLDALKRTYLHGFQAFNQFDVEPYRLDFALIHPDGRKVCVEVDGHDFHERTKEQAQRDKERDRFLTLQGWKILRFTGREVHRDADQCVEDVVELLAQRTA